MNIFNKDVNYIVIEDLSFTLINKNLSKTYELPKGIVKNFEVLDKSYLFYLLKKEFKDSEFDNFVIIGPSDKFIKLKLETPNISQDEMESMIYYEIENAIPINLEDYTYVYDYKKLEDKIEFKITLIEKHIIKDYEDIFEKLGKRLKAIYSVSDLIAHSRIYFSLNHLTFKDKELVEKAYFDDIYDILDRYDLDYYSLARIAEDKFEEFDEARKEELKNNLRALVFKRIDYIKKHASYENPIFFGNFILDLSKKILKEDFSKAEFKEGLENFEINPKLNFIKEKENKNIKLFFILGIFILANLTFLLHINSSIKEESGNNKILQQENVKIDKKLSSLDTEAIKNKSKELEEEKNKNKQILIDKDKNQKLIDLFLSLEEKQNENLFFNYYKMGTDSLYLSGFASSKSDLDNFINSIEYKNEIENLEIEDNIYNFKMEIYLGEVN